MRYTFVLIYHLRRFKIKIWTANYSMEDLFVLNLILTPCDITLYFEFYNLLLHGPAVNYLQSELQ